MDHPSRTTGLSAAGTPAGRNRAKGKPRIWLALLLLAAWLTAPATITAQSTDEPVVRAVLFYSPTCGHCHYVINEVLVPLANAYGEQLQIVAIDVSQPEGGQLFQAALAHLVLYNLMVT